MRLHGVILLAGLAGCYHSTSIDEDGDVETTLAGDESAGATSSSSGGDESSGGWWPTTGAGETGTAPTTVTTSGSESTGGGESGGDSTGAAETSGEATSGSTTDGVDADCPRVRVTVPPGEVLNVRPTPSTAMAAVGTLANGAIVDVIERVQGEVLDGNGEWFHVEGFGLEGYVWSGLVTCTTDEPPQDGFFLPLECGKTAKVSQGNFGDFSHQGSSAYAFDFAIGVGTPMVAIAEGTVTHLYAGTKPGDPCYDGGGEECITKANYVTLLHGDGTTSIYAHLSEVAVGKGELVPRGTTIGLSGSTGPHAHVARQEGCGSSHCQSIAVKFADVPGDGVPDTGDMVTSGNCP